MRWKAAVSDDPGSFNCVIRLALVYDDEMHVATPGDGPDPVMVRERPASEVPALLKLPAEAIEALRDALNGHAPPSSDKDVREALKVERARVDQMLGMLTGGDQ